MAGCLRRRPRVPAVRIVRQWATAVLLNFRPPGAPAEELRIVPEAEPQAALVVELQPVPAELEIARVLVRPTGLVATM